MALTDKLTAIADAIRTKTGKTDPMTLDQMVAEIDGISGGGGSPEEWFNDGNTHIWITLHEGRTSPMLGVCPNGTVTVDWGDGTDPDTLTGTRTSTVAWTPNHEYAKPGDYVITLTVDGEMGFSGVNSNFEFAYLLRSGVGMDDWNKLYQAAVKKIEIGSGVTAIGDCAFTNCVALESIAIPDSVTRIGNYAFNYCYALKSVVIPDGVAAIGNNVFEYCYTLASVVIPDSVTSIGYRAFGNCFALESIAISDGVTSIGTEAFSSCYALSSIPIPDSVTSIGDRAFSYCHGLESIVIPGSIGSGAFSGCYALSSVVISGNANYIGSSAFSSCNALISVVIPPSVMRIDDYAFRYGYGIRYIDFAKHTAVPTLSNTNAFTNISVDFEIRVPAALYDEWIAATNWATYADNIVAV